MPAGLDGIRTAALKLLESVELPRAVTLVGVKVSGGSFCGNQDCKLNARGTEHCTYYQTQLLPC